jgi:hypothetical protein
MSDKSEQIRIAIGLVATELPMKFEEFKERIERELEFYEVCKEAEFIYDETPSLVKIRIKENIYEVWDTKDEVICDEEHYEVYSTMRVLTIQLPELMKPYEIIESYEVKEVRRIED